MKRIVMLLSVLLLLSGLIGCKEEITSAYPDPNIVVELQPGENMTFKVEGPVNTLTTKCVWIFQTEADGYWGPVQNGYVLERKNEYKFEVNPAGETTNWFKISCFVLHFEWMKISGEPPLWGFWWIEKDSRSWYVRIRQDMKPVWQGNYLIRDNTDIQLLDGYTKITGDLSIFENNTLSDLSGLENLTTVEGDVNIKSNNGLVGISGLENLVTIGGNFCLLSNSALSGISGLRKLTTVGGNLFIIDNPSLTSISAMRNLTTVGDYLNIRLNSTLTELGMDGLYSVTGDFNIDSNDMLCNFLAESLRDQVLSRGGIGGKQTIDDNLLCDKP